MGENAPIIASAIFMGAMGHDDHRNSHDGIRILGGDQWVIEGNGIHNLDDGVNDDDGTDWNRHSDGIHILTLFGATTNLTVRRNLFYHIESMGVMINASELADEGYENFVFENNIFGPTGGLLFHGGAHIHRSFIFGNNTIVYAPDDTWTSIYPNNIGALEQQGRSPAPEPYDFPDAPSNPG